MTEVTGSNDTPNTLISENVPIKAPEQSAAPVSAQTGSEVRLFTQSEVNDLVGHARREGREVAERHIKANDSPQPSNSSSPISQDEIKRLAAEEVQKHREEWVRQANEAQLKEHYTKLASDFLTKMSVGKEKYQDFDTVVSKLDFTKIPDIVQLVNDVDNVADVMYDLAQNPEKIVQIRNLTSLGNEFAASKVLKLSSSIKDNQAASNTRRPNEPLSQMRPSNTRVEGGNLSMSDLKRMYRG